MKAHETYRYVVTKEDLESPQRDHIKEEVTGLLDDDGSVKIEVSDEGVLELVVPSRIPNTKKPTVREIFREHVEYSFDSIERVLLDLHVTWPTPTYRVCIGFQ